MGPNPKFFPSPGGRRGVSIRAAWRFACEAFAQEPIHHQLGLNLKLGWCGPHDCAGPPSLLARNPVGRGWWVVDVAEDRGAIRHDLFPKQSELERRPGSKSAIGLGSSQLDQRTLFFSTLSRWPPVTARAIYARPTVMAVQFMNWSCGRMTATGAGARPAQPANATPSATIPRFRMNGSLADKL